MLMMHQSLCGLDFNISARCAACCPLLMQNIPLLVFNICNWVAHNFR